MQSKETFGSLSNRDERFLAVALALAATSTCRSQRHGAIIVHGGSVIATGVNSDKNNPLVFETNLFKSLFCSVHAEVAAIKKVSNPAKLRGSVIYVARIGKRGQPMMSRPCESCCKVIMASGIKEMVYTT